MTLVFITNIIVALIATGLIVCVEIRMNRLMRIRKQLEYRIRTTLMKNR